MIDLRSDTITLPTPEMLEAMAKAHLGDDMREGDPTVRALEDTAASMLGKERGLFVTSGTMGNIVALLTHTSRGQEVLIDSLAHILRSEVGGLSQIAGLFYRTYPARRGSPDPGALSAMIKSGSRHSLATGLICIESTHNTGGGAVVPLETMGRVHTVSRERNVPVHLDGARLFNAAVALDVPASDIVRHVDSATFCLSKGLSAPFGSILCGADAFIERARLFRRMIGGGMRQAGVVAAAGIVALNQMVERLKDDHATARAIAEGLRAIDKDFIDPQEVETNILMVNVGHTSGSASQWVAALAEHEVDIRAWSPTSLRIVTHRHIGDADADAAVEAFRSVYVKRFGRAT